MASFMDGFHVWNRGLPISEAALRLDDRPGSAVPFIDDKTVKEVMRDYLGIPDVTESNRVRRMEYGTYSFVISWYQTNRAVPWTQREDARGNGGLKMGPLYGADDSLLLMQESFAVSPLSHRPVVTSLTGFDDVLDIRYSR